MTDDPFSVKSVTAGRETFGGTVTLLPNATYPIHVNGLGGHSVADARALRNDLDSAIRGAECLALVPATHSPHPWRDEPMNRTFSERVVHELEALCPCSTDPDSLNFGPLPECPVDGDGVTFVAEVLRLRAVEQGRAGTIVESGPGRGCPRVKGRCLSCNARSLFLGAGARVTCASLSCTSPCAVDDYLDGAVTATPAAPGGDGADDSEVWIPPSTDCMDHAHEPCPHCESRVHHHRTGRCGTCGRRPGTPVDEMEEHFVDANERLGDALVRIGMALGLPAPRTGATWGAPEILAKIAAGAPGDSSPPADTRPRAEHPCPDCGGEVLRVDHAMDPSDYQCRDQFDCCWTSETPPSSSTAGW